MFLSFNDKTIVNEIVSDVNKITKKDQKKSVRELFYSFEDKKFRRII